MDSVISAIKNTISISLFNKGLAGRIFADVRNTGAKVVIKNNIPECVLISPEDYIKLIDTVNDAKLLSIASSRMEKFDPNCLISYEEMNKKLNLTDENLDNCDEVEFEY